MSRSDEETAYPQLDRGQNAFLLGDGMPFLVLAGSGWYKLPVVPGSPDTLSNWVTSQWLPSRPIPKLWKKASDMLRTKLTEAQELHGPVSTTGLQV